MENRVNFSVYREENLADGAECAEGTKDGLHKNAEKKKKKESEGVSDALLKVALGCSVAEVTEEYAEVDGKLKLMKRKKTKKDIPPDLKAVQLILEKCANDGDVAAMSDEELEKEKLRLLKLLEKETKIKKPETAKRKTTIKNKAACGNETVPETSARKKTAKRKSVLTNEPVFENKK